MKNCRKRKEKRFPNSFDFYTVIFNFDFLIFNLAPPAHDAQNMALGENASGEYY